MIQKHRISTNIGKDHRVNVDIKQNFDILEILSLKFSQKDIYASGGCAGYGVVVGRVSANNGFGVPNAKVSIFIPQSSMDSTDPVISQLYPYQEISDNDENGFRYNLLPARQQHSGHAPTGTFPDQQDILTREEVLEVFESYYKYTVKTNQSGDFMIWGVPIGSQTIHVDLDLSDIGCFSLRPYDFLKAGFGEGEFERFYKFKSSPDINGLPQIVTFDRTIEVYPLWGDENICEIGITRTDFDLTNRGIVINPISLVLASTITDDTKDAVKRNGKIRKSTGYKCNLQTTGGYIECVRQTGKTVYGSDGVTTYPELEYYTIAEVINEDGVAMAVLPMNLEYVYTDEFGVEQITNDPNKGIPTTAIARFRFSLDFEGSKVSTANYLVPNIREFNPSSSGDNNKYEYHEGMLASYVFSDVFEDYLTVTPPDGTTLNSTGYGSGLKTLKKELMLGTNNNNIPEDYFYKFIYGKVYTVSSFQGTHYETARRDSFLGIKQIRPAEDEDCSSNTNYIPTNFGYKNRVKFSLLLTQVVLFVQYIFAAILIKFAEVIGRLFWALGVAFYNIGIRRWRPFKKISERFKNAAYNMQEKFTAQLPLTIYPDCEECTTDANAQSEDSSFLNDYCRVGEIKMWVQQYTDDRQIRLTMWQSNDNSTSYQNQDTDPSYLWSETDSFNNLFPGEYSRDGEGLCSTSDVVNYSDLKGLYTGVTTNPVPGFTIDARYVCEVYPYAGVWSGTGVTLFSPYIVYLNGENPNSNISNGKIARRTPGGNEAVALLPGDASDDAGTQGFYSYEQWNELTGMDFDVLPEGLTEQLYAIVRIYDRDKMKETPTIQDPLTVEAGCEKYDKTYDESKVFGYIWSSGSTYDPTIIPFSPTGLPETDINIQSYTGVTGYEAWGIREFLRTTTPPTPYSNLLSTMVGSSNTQRLPYKVEWKKIPNATYNRKTKSGLTEFRDGVFTIIPVIAGTSYNLSTLQEWYRRKRIGMSFCGGVVNYSFIDNWLNGLLYFFKFDKRLRWDNERVYDLNQRGSKFPRELVFFHVFDKKFYYRSCPFYNGAFSGQTFDGRKEILHPTTFYDVGVRDEFLNEICLDPRVDPNCSVVRDISTTSYQDPAFIAEYAINYRLDVTNGDFGVDDFFSGTNYGTNIKVFDGDITQLMSINCETGIEAFDLDSPHYFMYNGDYMDPENTSYNDYFKDGGNFRPAPIDLKFDYNGSFVRGCLNYRLGDYSQVVPFYLWDKGGEGFGPSGNNSDNQKWDKSSIAYMKLQRLYSVSGYTAYDLGNSTTPGQSNYVMRDGEEEYLLRPMTVDHDTYWWYGDFENSLERFDNISYVPPLYMGIGEAQSLMGYIDGQLWLEVKGGSLSNPIHGYIWVVVDSTWVRQTSHQYYDGYYETFLPQTVNNYASSKQVLSTPFLFYFGLKPGSTSLDLLTKYFGPKGAFGTTEVICPAFDVTPTPSSTSAPAVSPPETPPASGSYVTPTPTPTPSNSPPAAAPASMSISPSSGYRAYDKTGSGNAVTVDLYMTNVGYWGITYGTAMPFLMPAPDSYDMENLVLKVEEPGCGPSWLTFETYNFYSGWQEGFCGTYSESVNYIRFYANTQNTGSAREAEFEFTDGGTPFSPAVKFTFTQGAYNPPTATYVSWQYSNDLTINYANISTGVYSYSFSFMWNDIARSGLPWSIVWGGTTQASGTWPTITPGHNYGASGTFTVPPPGGTVYLYIGIAI